MNSSPLGSLLPPRSPRPSRRAVVKAAGVAGLSGAVAFVRPWPGQEPVQPVTAGAGRSLVLAADQASERVLLLDVDDPSWQRATPEVHDLRAARAASWSWSALDHEDLAGLDPKRTWTMVSEAKYRVWNGGSWVLTCASGGLAAMVSFPDGWVRWAGRTGTNAHSVEVLPDGNVAVAASTQDCVRIYTASQSPLSTRYAQFDLSGAHGLQWDQNRRLLWAVGTTRLVALAVSGSASHPRMKLERSVLLPSQAGHDLNAVASAPDRMWITTSSHIHQYSVTRNVFVPYVGEKGIDGPGVKSISDDPASGQVLTVAPDDENPCQWCTSTLTFHLPDGRSRIAKTSLYKARWMPAVPTTETLPRARRTGRGR